MPNRFFFWGRVAALLLLGLFHCAVSALPLEHEQRRLLMATDNAVKEARWDDAAGYLSRLEALGDQQVLEYHYLRGRVMAQQGKALEAKASLETFVMGADVESERYREALALITRLESQPVTPVAAEPVALIEPARPDTAGKAQSVAKGSGSQGLLEQVNQQLEQLAYRTGKVVRLDQLPVVQYVFGFGGAGELTVRESRLAGTGIPESVIRTLSVYGVSPVIRLNCQAQEQGCWLYDPRDGSRWLQVTGRVSDAELLARRIGQLIRSIQTP